MKVVTYDEFRKMYDDIYFALTGACEGISYYEGFTKDRKKVEIELYDQALSYDGFLYNIGANMWDADGEANDDAVGSTYGQQFPDDSILYADHDRFTL